MVLLLVVEVGSRVLHMAIMLELIACKKQCFWIQKLLSRQKQHKPKPLRQFLQHRL
jgi:hypothetical protein